MGEEPPAKKEDPPKKVWKSAHENDRKNKYGNRDLVGYGKNPIQPHWPRSAKCALNFVVNFEEGAEMCSLHGDNQSEHLLSDIPGAVPFGAFKFFLTSFILSQDVFHSFTNLFFLLNLSSFLRGRSTY